jgi:replicative DNA helicase
MRDLLTIIDLPAIRIGNIRQLVRREMAFKQYKIIMVDYLQLAQGDGKQDKRYLEVGQISRGLKALAREMDVPVIAAAQLSRAVEQRTNKKPILSDLREAGDIEQDADIVMFIHMNEEDTEEGDIIIAKHRNGKTANVPVIFRKHLTRFESKAKV